MASTPNTWQFKVAMSCSGCSGAVQRVLTKNGESDFDISLETQTVTVRSNRSQQEVLAIIQKSGKAVETC